MTLAEQPVPNPYPAPADPPSRLAIALVAVFWLGVGFVAWKTSSWVTSDYREFLLPWYRFILEHGRLGAFALDFSNYTPPYLYLISLGTLLDGLASPLAIIKAISVLATLLVAWPVYLVARRCGRTPGAALLAALLFCGLPEVVLNAVAWAQCDIIYTGCLIGFALAVMRRQGPLAMVMLGLAFAFKLQTVLAGPVVLYLLLVGVLRWWQLLLVPATYLVLMLPAALAGRPLGDLLTIYLGQFDYYQFLSMNAPNPWMLVDLLLPGHYALGTRLGLGLAALGGVGLVAAFLRLGRNPAPATLLLMLASSLTLLPWLLPKMHERYFFPAACFGFLLAVARPAMWPVAVLLQVANLITYRAFLLGTYAGNWLAVLPMSLALALLLHALWREPRRD